MVERVPDVRPSLTAAFAIRTAGTDTDQLAIVFSPAKPGDEGLRVFVTPTDDAGDALKAAGVFTVEAFDLAGPQPVKLGTWTFDLAASRKLWSSFFNRFHYTLPCPWQVRQVVTPVPGLAPLPSQVTQVTSVGTSISTVRPRKASSRLISRL